MKEEGFILTSNRDEKKQRQTTAPAIHEKDGVILGFPQDTLSGGSWIAANSTGRLCCLLNGAFVPHQKQDFHTLSRGKVLMEMVSSIEEGSVFLENRDLTNVEPFTIVTIEHVMGEMTKFTESIWDGSRKHFRELDKQKPYVWSSVTLYSPEHRKLRRDWFDEFLTKYHTRISPEEVYHFHSGTHTEDQAVNVIMNRENGIKTVSITQVTPNSEKLFMKYYDLIEKTDHEILI